MPSATRGDLFVLKTPFSAKKIQKHEILPCKKLLFSLSGIHCFWGICDKLN